MATKYVARLSEEPSSCYRFWLRPDLILSMNCGAERQTFSALPNVEDRWRFLSNNGFPYIYAN